MKKPSLTKNSCSLSLPGSLFVKDRGVRSTTLLLFISFQLSKRKVFPRLIITFLPLTARSVAFNRPHWFHHVVFLLNAKGGNFQCQLRLTLCSMPRIAGIVSNHACQQSRSYGRVEGGEHGVADVETMGLDDSAVRVFDCAGQVTTVLVSIFKLSTGARERRHLSQVSTYISGYPLCIHCVSIVYSSPCPSKRDRSLPSLLLSKYFSWSPS